MLEIKRKLTKPDKKQMSTEKPSETQTSSNTPETTQIKGVVQGKVIGQGTFAYVKFAYLKKNPSRTFAIKFINRAKCRSMGLTDDDMSKEVMIHKNCSGHPHIIQLLDIGSDKRFIWMILEYASLGDLFDKIEPDVGLEEDVAHFYFKQYVGAMSFLHSRGIAHRDIKPENILLDKNGDLKLADFGLACVFRKKNGDKRFQLKACGSPPYMAPEIAKIDTQKGYDPEMVDVWSSGVLLYVLLTGETLWDEPTDFDPDFKYYLENTNKIDLCYPWSKLSVEVVALLKSILKFDAKDRFSFEKIRKHPWVNRDNKLANSKGLCDDPRILVKKLIARMKVDLGDDEFMRVTQQATQMSQMIADLGKKTATSQPTAPKARMFSGSNPHKNNGDDKDGVFALPALAATKSKPGFAASQQEFTEHSKRLEKKLDRRDSDLLRFQMISKDPAILQFINASDRRNMFSLQAKMQSPQYTSKQNCDDGESDPKRRRIAVVEDFFVQAQRLTRFFSILPIESLLEILLDSLHQMGISIPITDETLLKITEKECLPKIKAAKKLTGSDEYQYATIKIDTMDSRKGSMKGYIRITKIGNITLKKVTFDKFKGDPLQWRSFFKKVTVLSREAVYVDQSLK